MKSVENIVRHLIPHPKFYGSLVKNNEEAYSLIEWADERPKPTWQELLDASVEYEAEETEKKTRSTIKSLANQVILSLAPEWKQRNMLAKALQIENLQRRGESTPEQDAIAEAIISSWDRIEAVRSRSDALEAEYVALGEELTSEDLETIREELENA